MSRQAGSLQQLDDRRIALGFLAAQLFCAQAPANQERFPWGVPDIFNLFDWKAIYVELATLVGKEPGSFVAKTHQECPFDIAWLFPAILEASDSEHKEQF